MRTSAVGGVACFWLVNRWSGNAWSRHVHSGLDPDWSQLVRELLDVQYPWAEQVILVMDHLNTHPIGSLYETFAPEEAERLCLRLEIHPTPKHGSWLNMAEIELSALGRQCLDRRLSTLEQVQAEVQAWQQERNHANVAIDWRFTTADARIKLKRLYPVSK